MRTEYIFDLSCGCSYRYLFEPNIERHALGMIRHSKAVVGETSVMVAECTEPLKKVDVMALIRHHMDMRAVMGLEDSFNTVMIERTSTPTSSSQGT